MTAYRAPRLASDVLSVIVPTYNGAHVLPKTVPAMLAQSEPAEWLFVDDGSEDDTAPVLDRLLARGFASASAAGRVLRHPVNRGRAAARNTGVEAASGDRLLFLDADVAPQPGYVAALGAALRGPGAVAAVGRLAYADVDPSDPYHRYLQSGRRGPRERGVGEPLPWRYFLLGVGAVRAGVVREAGPFDAALSYGEDVEYACRLAHRYPDGLRFAPDAVGLLHDLGTLETALAKMAEFGEDNLPLLVARYPEAARSVGVEVLDGRSGAREAVVQLLLRPGPARLVRGALPFLPPGLSDYAVRYLLGVKLAESYRRGRAGVEAR